MSSSKAQKERIIKLSTHEKKLSRLFHNKKLTNKDFIMINYIYEEKQHLNFYYGIIGSACFSLFSNYAFFRTNSGALQSIYLLATFALLNAGIRQKVDNRFASSITPYFEKYQIK